MRISVFGLGYVGVVTSACLADRGNTVIGVDISQEKIDLVNGGKSPIVEDKIDDVMARAVESGKLRATSSATDAIENSDIAIVCVGTPSRIDGSLDTSYVKAVIGEIGAELRDRKEPFVVVVRSTILPSTMRDIAIPELETSSGQQIGRQIDIVFHPEFLREGSSVDDFYDPPKIVVGAERDSAADLVMSLYEGIEAPRIVTTLEIAEMVKYCDNIFHALKVTFANEVGAFCHELEIDSQQVMELFTKDEKLNISSKYLRPGFAFGGSCLPKDMRAFLSAASDQHLDLPMLQSVLVSNRAQIERAVRHTVDAPGRRVGFFGIAFKPGTDDLRESPYVELAERLLGKGHQLTIVDENVQISRLLGKNRSFIDDRLPHLAEFMRHSVDELQHCEIAVVCHPCSTERMASWLEAGMTVIDLAGRDQNLINETNYTSIV